MYRKLAYARMWYRGTFYVYELDGRSTHTSLIGTGLVECLWGACISIVPVIEPCMRLILCSILIPITGGTEQNPVSCAASNSPICKLAISMHTGIPYPPRSKIKFSGPGNVGGPQEALNSI